MPAKLLLQLRLLNPCLPVNSVPPAALRLGLGPGPGASLSSSALTFSLALPFRLKHHHHRRFSTRSDRSRSDFSASRSSKSLVDDEAELSAWMTSLRGDKPESDLGGRSDRGSKRTRVSESDSDGLDGFSERRTGPGSSVGPLSRTSPPPPPRRQMDSRRTGRFDSERDGNGNRSPRSREVGNSFSRKRPMDARQGNEKPGSFSRDSQMSRRFDSKRGEGNGEYLARKSIPRFQDGKLENSKGRLDSRNRVALLSEDDDDEDDGVVGGVNKLAIGDLLSDDESDEVEDDEDEDIGNVMPKGNAKAPVRASSPGDSESYLSDTRFDQCSVSPLSLKAIKDAGYVKMTVVQEATLSVILKGKDVLAKAKTGTGKTVAFLLPSIEVVVNSPPAGRDQKRPPILVLVMCPTRELACQASTEANSLLKYHPTIGVQVVIGGTRLALEQKRLQANPCQILVATPGRLRDHIENTAGFATRLMGVKVLVLDEADHMLDMGFRKDIERIIAAVPKQRQTLLFSATVPEEVRQVCHIALKRDHEFINTVQGGSEDTHSQVKQKHLIAPSDKQFALLYTFLKEHIADDVDYKVIVFCTTAMLTKLVAEFLGELKMNVREIHSRKSQSYRTKVSDEFRKSKGLILVTSDVSARGVDYPDVTLVIQLGLPGDKQQYIHRLGRTGRKGKEGEGLLLLAPWEEFFLYTIKDLPVTKATEPSVDPDAKKKVERALSNVEMKSKEAAYQAWLGYYNSNKTVGRDKYKLVELANEFSRSMGLDNPPAIPKLVLGKMGLKNIPGLRVK